MSDEFDLDLSKYVTAPEGLTLPELIYLYGPFGQGKTHLAASAADVEDLYPVLIIDTENSTQGTIQNFPKGRIDVIRPTKLWPGQEWKMTKVLLNGLLTKKHKYKTVIIDVADVLFDWALAYAKAENPNDGFAKWNYVHSEFTAPPNKEDWGLFHRLKAADFLAILVVHEKKEASSDDGPVFADFQWAGQGRTKMGGIPDVVGYVTRDTNAGGVSTTTLHTAPTKRNNAKNRYGFPAKIVDPSMKKLYELIENRENH